MDRVAKMDKAGNTVVKIIIPAATGKEAIQAKVVSLTILKEDGLGKMNKVDKVDKTDRVGNTEDKITTPGKMVRMNRTDKGNRTTIKDLILLFRLLTNVQVMASSPYKAIANGL